MFSSATLRFAISSFSILVQTSRHGRVILITVPPKLCAVLTVKLTARPRHGAQIRYSAFPYRTRLQSSRSRLALPFASADVTRRMSALIRHLSSSTFKTELAVRKDPLARVYVAVATFATTHLTFLLTQVSKFLRSINQTDHPTPLCRLSDTACELAALDCASSCAICRHARGRGKGRGRTRASKAVMACRSQ